MTTITKHQIILDDILARRKVLSDKMKPLREQLNPLKAEDEELAILMANIIDPEQKHWNRIPDPEQAYHDFCRRWWRYSDRGGGI